MSVTTSYRLVTLVGGEPLCVCPPNRRRRSLLIGAPSAGQLAIGPDLATINNFAIPLAVGSNLQFRLGPPDFEAAAQLGVWIYNGVGCIVGVYEELCGCE